MPAVCAARWAVSRKPAVLARTRGSPEITLLVPGGTVGADKLRGDAGAVRLIRGFFEAGKPVGVICHGPWTLVEADVVRGRTLTSWPTLATDIRNAGGTAVGGDQYQNPDLPGHRYCQQPRSKYQTGAQVISCHLTGRRETRWIQPGSSASSRRSDATSPASTSNDGGCSSPGTPGF
jgi:putative intracellular protease/amidase